MNERDIHIKEVIYEESCDWFNMNLRKRSRKNDVVICRHCCINYLLKMNKYSLQSIGRLFGLDHTTVIHARTRHDNAMDINEKGYLSQWEPYKKHMDVFLMKRKMFSLDRAYVIEFKNDTAALRARDLEDAGTLSDFIEHQLLQL